MDNHRETTDRRLSEVRRHNRTSLMFDRVTRWTRKDRTAPLNKTEQAVLEIIGATGLTLSAHGDGKGYVSNALIYAKELDRLSKPQCKALLSLLDRGRLAVVDTGTTERVERRSPRHRA